MKSLGWIGLRFLWALGYLWGSTCPVFWRSGWLLLLASLAGAVEYVRFVGPGVLVKLRGPFAKWMANGGPNVKWYGRTIGPFMFFFVEPEPQQIQHENRHCIQQMALGIFDPVVYAVSWSIQFLKTRDAFQAYRNCVLERDARRAAGEEV